MRINIKGFIVFDGFGKIKEYTNALIQGYKDGKLKLKWK